VNLRYGFGDIVKLRHETTRDPRRPGNKSDDLTPGDRYVIVLLVLDDMGHESLDRIDGDTQADGDRYRSRITWEEMLQLE
jgi:hypothetical protein